MGLIDSLWNKLLGDPKKPGGNKPHVKAAARDAARSKRSPPPAKKTKATPPAKKTKAAPPAKQTKAAPPVKKPEGAPPASGDPRADATASIRANQARIMTPEREELISNALAVHRAKQKILADLSDDDRRKLMVTAMRALLNEGKEQDP